MKVLITGGAGFIGSHLAKKLLSAKHNVTIADSFDPYYQPDRKKQQLAEVEKLNLPFTFLEMDLLEEDNCRKIILDGQFDAIIHLAALPGVPASLLNPARYIDYDVKMTVNLLKQASEANVGHFLFASSSSVYGNQSGMPLQEDMANGRTASPYAAAKAGAEAFCRAYESLYGFKLTILRFFTVYGPWGRPDMAITNFVFNLLEGKRIKVFDRNSARDYTYIDDIADGINRALVRPGNSAIYNLGAGSPVSMQQLLELLEVRFPAMEIEVAGKRPGDVEETWSDITKAQLDLGFFPQVQLEEGLDLTIQWAKNYLNR
ncbi:NAD-dependent epimerase/dehydratase family protein [Planococcus lenghuensis]|uniref:UDP-glucose 4-epimerase n=1 Tax=Planococcus lenghuensis TaxID=2213202 RepID=A0A1Q2KZ59_9BACL|nr:NAD-dependent epimerase/dehydratase family protein [Planococcus lenghuensis]AQQ53453.1 UDP-glucose 4-epimerase [Planococcus lenghuensis]